MMDPNTKQRIANEAIDLIVGSVSNLRFPGSALSQAQDVQDIVNIVHATMRGLCAGDFCRWKDRRLGGSEE